MKDLRLPKTGYEVMCACLPSMYNAIVHIRPWGLRQVFETCL